MGQVPPEHQLAERLERQPDHGLGPRSGPSPYTQPLSRRAGPHIPTQSAPTSLSPPTSLRTPSDTECHDTPYASATPSLVLRQRMGVRQTWTSGRESRSRSRDPLGS
eukprot:2826733-Rhodomonas_salina.1